MKFRPASPLAVRARTRASSPRTWVPATASCSSTTTTRPGTSASHSTGVRAEMIWMRGKSFEAKAFSRHAFFNRTLSVSTVQTCILEPIFSFSRSSRKFTKEDSPRAASVWKGVICSIGWEREKKKREKKRLTKVREKGNNPLLWKGQWSFRRRYCIHAYTRIA